MYPTVVIVLVETQRSMTDICEISLSDTSRLTGPVAFEPHLATIGDPSVAATSLLTMMDKEAESQGSHEKGRQEHGLEEFILEVNECRRVGIT